MIPRVLAIVVTFVLVLAVLHGQTVNPTTVEFTASSAHHEVNPLPISTAGDPAITWERMPSTGLAYTWRAQNRLHWDPISKRVIAYVGSATSSGIYSNTFVAIDVSGPQAVFTRIGGTEGDNSPCYDDSTGPVSLRGGWNNGDGSDKQPWLADRHPEDQNTIVCRAGACDYIQWSGLACGNPESGRGRAWNDLWSLRLNANPILSTWRKLAPRTLPSVSTSAAMVDVPTYDVIVLHGVIGASGFPATWLYCRTDSGVLSAKQLRVGCTTADDWIEIYRNTNAVFPPNPSNPNIEYDAITDRVYLWPMQTGQPTEIYAYDLLAKKWTKVPIAKAPTNSNPGGSPETLWTRIPSGPWTNKFFYHRTSHAGTGSGQASDYLFDPVAKTITPLLSTGTGPEGYADLVAVPLEPNGVIFAVEWGPAISAPVLWKGTLRQ